MRATAICDGTIRVKDLPERVQQYCKKQAEFNPTPEIGDTTPLLVEEWSSLSEVEGRYVEKVLTHTHGNKQAASRILEIDRKTLDRMIKRHQLSVGHIAKFPSAAHVN